MNYARSLLKTAFLASAMLLTQCKSRDVDSKPQNLYSRPPINPIDEKTGFLYIAGPENERDINLQESVQSKAAAVSNFQTVFKDFPVETVGNGVEAIHAADIVEKLNLLAKQDITNIVVLTNLNGVTSAIRDKKNNFKNTNSLLIDKTGKQINAEKFYGTIARTFEKNPQLHNKNLHVVHYSTNGESAMNAFHLLPPGTRVFYYSDRNNNSYGLPAQDNFAQAYEQLTQLSPQKHVPMSRAGILASAVFATPLATANLDDIHLFPESIQNTFHMIEIQNGAPDTIVQNETKFYLGTHLGSRPLYVDDIVHALEEKDVENYMTEYSTFINMDTMAAVFSSYKKEIEGPRHLAPQSNAYYCYLNLIKASFALQDAQFMQRDLTQFSIYVGLMGKVKPDTTNKLPVLKP